MKKDIKSEKVLLIINFLDNLLKHSKEISQASEEFTKMLDETLDKLEETIKELTSTI